MKIYIKNIDMCLVDTTIWRDTDRVYDSFRYEVDYMAVSGNNCIDRTTSIPHASDIIDLNRFKEIIAKELSVYGGGYNE